MNHPSPLLTLVLCSSLSVCAFAVAGASFSVPTESTNTSAQTLAAGNSGTVESNASLSVSGSSVAVTITGSSTLTNNGTIEQTGTARGIYNNTAAAVLTLNNNGTITSLGDDVIKVGKGTAGIILNNQGTIWQKGTGAGAGQALDLTSINSAGSTIINGSTSNTAALIQADGDDALRPGSNMSILNYGTIISRGSVNTKMTGTLASGATEAKAQDGIDVQDRIGVSVDNYGLISGPRHGITADNEISVTNQIGGIIIGNNGSGVGSDGTGTVINYGTITGAYAGAGNAYEHSATNGGTSTANNGDGDGVDVDGIATITNYGTIQGLGAGGVDSGGNPNGADGIAAGGGTIINHAGATIYGQSKGILIDDGANGTTSFVRGTASSGVGLGDIATITNDGTITGDKKTAIGLVGNYADSITNNTTGIITGGKDSVLVDALASTTAAAAIQMGGGNDTLTNYGKIEGKNALAIDMGEGDDTLHLLGGNVIGTITGGSGTNSLILGGTQHYSKNSISNFQNITTQDSAVIEAEIKAATDLLPFTGTVILADGTSIEPIVKGKIADGSSHTIISATSLTANTTQLNIIDTSATFDFSLETSGNDLNVIAERVVNLNTLSDSKLTGFANALESMGNTINTQEVIGILNSIQTTQEVSNAIKQLSPDISNAALNAALSSQGNVFGAFSTRMGMNHTPHASLSSGLSAGDNDTSFGWAQLLGSTAKQNARQGADGYKIDSAGVAIGFEHEISHEEILGFSGGYTGAKSYGQDGSSGDITEIDTFHAGVYYSLNKPSFTLDTALVGSINHYNGKRLVDILGLTQTLNSTYEGYTIGAMAEAGYPIALNPNWSVRPLAGLQYSYNATESYDENGGSAALHMEDQDFSSFKGSLGAEFTHRLDNKSGYSLSFRYLREFASAPKTTAGFIGEGTTFSVSGVKPPKNEFQFGTNYEILTSEGKTLSIGYDATFKEEYLAHQLNLKMVF